MQLCCVSSRCLQPCILWDNILEMFYGKWLISRRLQMTPRLYRCLGFYLFMLLSFFPKMEWNGSQLLPTYLEALAEVEILLSNKFWKESTIHHFHLLIKKLIFLDLCHMYPFKVKWSKYIVKKDTKVENWFRFSLGL